MTPEQRASPRSRASRVREWRRSAGSFQQLTEPRRRELLVHCYRMLGPFTNAEDLVQETLLRAWRGLEGFDGVRPTRYWLYRIATKRLLERPRRARERRPRAAGNRKPGDRTDAGPANRGPRFSPNPNSPPRPWLEPLPGLGVGADRRRSARADARYEMREAVQLAFVAAIQLLPPASASDPVAHRRAGLVGRRERPAAAIRRSRPSTVPMQARRTTLEERLAGRPSRVAGRASAEQRAPPRTLRSCVGEH